MIAKRIIFGEKQYIPALIKGGLTRPEIQHTVWRQVCKVSLRQDVLVDLPVLFSRGGLSQAPVPRLSLLQIHPSPAVVMPVMGGKTIVT